MAAKPRCCSLFLFLRLLLRRGEPFQALEKLFLRHAVDSHLGVIGIDRATGGTDQRSGLGFRLVDLHVFLQGMAEFLLEVVGVVGRCVLYTL